MRHLRFIKDNDTRLRLIQKRIDEQIPSHVITGEELMLMDIPNDN
jgi:hypothetical protein